MADMDWPRFAAAVKAARAATGMSFSAVIAVHPALTKSALTRAETGHVIGAGNVLVICAAFGIDPMAHLVRGGDAPAPQAADRTGQWRKRTQQGARKGEGIQAVSAGASRETGRPVSAAGSRDNGKPVLTIAAIARRIGRMREGG